MKNYGVKCSGVCFLMSDLVKCSVRLTDSEIPLEGVRWISIARRLHQSGFSAGKNMSSRVSKSE